MMFLSDTTKAKILTLKAAISFVRTGGTIAPRECNVCSYKGPFYPFGLHLRRDAACPRCHSLERHRLFKLCFESNKNLFRGEILHFAPEASVTRFVKPAASRYRTADYLLPADLKLNIECINLPNSFDAIIASHVLEHVDDKRALRSIYDSLKDGGTLFAMVPIAEGMATYEDSSITDLKERELHFGQYDHVRYYGSDFVDRVTAAGFRVERFTPSEPLISRHGLMRGETTFICRKLA